MLSFECDYNNGAHPDVLRHLVETNSEPTLTYGFDEYTMLAKEKIRQACQLPQADVFLLGGGTQTNAAVIDAMLRSYEAVLTVETGHIAVHEAGAIEHCGHKVVALPSHEGKLSAADLRQWMEEFSHDESRDHVAQPGMVYISLPTELGTLYTSRELKDIGSVCRHYGLPLFIDGARLGYGLASPAADLTLPELASLCDVFYIGGTKVGALCGEAVVFPKGNKPPHFMNTVKQHGALLAKGRLLGVQFDALFTDDLYFRISRHAIALAEKLKDVFRECGIPFALSSPTNQQFVILENARMEALREKVRFSFWEKYDDTHTVVRFATGWSTTEEDISALRGILLGSCKL